MHILFKPLYSYLFVMSSSKVTVLRLGDNINYPQKGESVGVHYTLRG